ncbi:MAG: ATP-binding cassette domain-containing protein [Firmicutes bacterium]|nr:ATP-binding cassette domain-containing protein [Bacillota bacterium]
MGLQVSDLHFTYDEGTELFHGLSFEVASGERIALIGSNGSGKSTLLLLIAGLLVPSKGRVVLDGRTIHPSRTPLAQARGHIGLALQQPERQLFANTVAEDIAFGPTQIGVPKEEVAARVEEASALVGLSKALLQRSPFTLSSGEARRAALAGILAMHPQLLLLDEPTAGLDAGMTQQFILQVNHFVASLGSTLLLVTHDPEVAAALCQRAVALEAGQIRYDGPLDGAAAAGWLTTAAWSVTEELARRDPAWVAHARQDEAIAAAAMWFRSRQGDVSVMATTPRFPRFNGAPLGGDRTEPLSQWKEGGT